METFNLAQLTKEMVVGQLSSLTEPARLAAQTVRGTLVVRLKGHRLSNYEIKEAVVEVCRGAIAGMILMECSLGHGAVHLLIAAEAAAKEADVDAELVASAAIKGIADARRFVTKDVLSEMRARLEVLRPDAGAAFEHFCDGLHPQQSHPDYVPPRS